MKKKLLLFLLVFAGLRFIKADAQVAISSTAATPDPSAMLDVKSSTKGMLIPRTSSSSRIAIINPAKGLMIYDTTTNSFWFHNGNAWMEITTGNAGWSLTGNSGTTSSDFIGTTDNQSLNFRVHNLPAGKLDETHANTFWGVSAGALTINGQNTAMGYFALRSNTVGTNNVAIGNKALYVYNGSFNTAIGDSAMANTVSTFGDNHNTAAGASSLTSNTWGYYNTATGAGSLFSNTTGIFNTATGFNALYKNTAGQYNTANGCNALFFNTGSDNTATGADALYSNTTGNDNTSQGYSALFANTTGDENTALGSGAMKKNKTGQSNTVIGFNALYSDTMSQNNTAQGANALFTNNGGSFNTAIGSGAMNKNTIGNYNTATGFQALYSNTTGSNNTAQGDVSLFSNTTGTYNTAIGSGAMNRNTIGLNNTAIGTDASEGNINGNANIAIGYSSLYSNTAGNYNVAIGTEALFSNQTNYNIGIGTYALYNNTSGANLTAIGNNALLNNTTGFDDDAFGDSSLVRNITGSRNVAIGQNTMIQNTTGSNNTALGNGTMSHNISGSYNTAIGYGAITYGSANTFATAIGADAIANCSYCVVLGGEYPYSSRAGINTSSPSTDLHIVQQSNTNNDNSRGIELQQQPLGNQWRTFIDPGNNYIFQYNNNLYGYIDPVGAAYHNFSDARLKKDIQPVNDVLEKVLQLKAVSYHYKKNNDTDPLLYGFVAQDVEKIFPDFVSTAGNGYKGIAYNNFSVMAIKAIQEQQLQLDELKKQHDSQQQQIDEIEIQIGLLIKNK